MSHNTKLWFFTLNLWFWKNQLSDKSWLFQNLKISSKSQKSILIISRLDTSDFLKDVFINLFVLNEFKTLFYAIISLPYHSICKKSLIWSFESLPTDIDRFLWLFQQIILSLQNSRTNVKTEVYEIPYRNTRFWKHYQWRLSICG